LGLILKLINKYLILFLLFKFHITHKMHQKELYEVIFIILHILQFLFIITFSESERKFISIPNHKVRSIIIQVDLEFVGDKDYNFFK